MPWTCGMCKEPGRRGKKNALILASLLWRLLFNVRSRRCRQMWVGGCGWKLLIPARSLPPPLPVRLLAQQIYKPGYEAGPQPASAPSASKTEETTDGGRRSADSRGPNATPDPRGRGSAMGRSSAGGGRTSSVRGGALLRAPSRVRGTGGTRAAAAVPCQWRVLHVRPGVLLHS